MRGKRMLLALAFAAAGLVGMAGAAEPKAQVRHELEVETDGGRVRVRLIIENLGDTTVYVPREVAAGNELTGPRFALREVKGGKAGKALAYTGMQVKRAALGPADYQAVAPHTVHMNTIDITGDYAFRKGKAVYELRYAGPWLADTARLDAVQYSPAAPLRFSR